MSAKETHLKDALMKTPKTLIEAVKFFSDIDRCNEYMVSIKWADGIACPKCNACGDRIGKIETRKMLRCKDCRKQFSYKVGTIFEDSPIGLDKWFVAVWCITNAKNGISSYELHRDLGVTQKSAWFMLHRIREALKSQGFAKLEGTVESDETFIRGKAKNMHKEVRERKIKGRGTVGKAVVQGVIARGGKVVAGVVPNQKRKSLHRMVRENVANGSTVYTDALKSYEGLGDDFIHEVIDHAKEYVRGDVHTNSMENFWSLLKRCISGTYISVMPWHLMRYVDEQVYRFNERNSNDAERFDSAMSNVVGRRVTYNALCETA